MHIVAELLMKFYKQAAQKLTGVSHTNFPYWYSHLRQLNRLVLTKSLPNNLRRLLINILHLFFLFFLIL
jgi:hypothetical protein